MSDQEVFDANDFYERELALVERHQVTGLKGEGPLTQVQTEREDIYEQRMLEEEAENDAFMAAGNRSLCPKCGLRTVKHGSACTLGYPGALGAEYSATYECENCDYKDIAG